MNAAIPRRVVSERHQKGAIPMQLKNLGKSSSNPKKAKKDIAVNLAMRLESIEMQEGKAGVYKGYLVGSNEPVSIRMMTIEEGVPVNTRMIPGNEGSKVPEPVEVVRARLHKQYVGNGEAHRPRPSDVANPKAKSHCAAGGLLMFERCLQNEDGSYRAHWIQVLEPTAGAGCEKVIANLQVLKFGEGDKMRRTVAADVLRPEAATILSSENVGGALMSAFNGRVGDEKIKPMVHLRVINKATGEGEATAAVHAHYVETKNTDPETGVTVEGYDVAEPKASVAQIFSPERTGAKALIARAVLFGLGKEPGYPKYHDDIDPAWLPVLNKATDDVRNGAVYVELVPGERIAAGPATRTSILKQYDAQDKHVIKTGYLGRVKDPETKKTSFEQRFGETYITTKIGKDGHRLFTKAVPADLWLKAAPLEKLATANDELLQSIAAQARVEEANVDERVVDDEFFFDPSAIDGDIGEDLDAKLASSAAALDSLEM
jgi:hypothetical protein